MRQSAFASVALPAMCAMLLLLLLLLSNASASLSCLDESGQPVGWFVQLKVRVGRLETILPASASASACSSHHDSLHYMPQARWAVRPKFYFYSRVLPYCQCFPAPRYTPRPASPRPAIAHLSYFHPPRSDSVIVIVHSTFVHCFWSIIPLPVSVHWQVSVRRREQ